ncbi:hypothetical protein PO124_34550 [Bacillus licheniformis]|nr:hypothetical protein [Bacillus licheniformis]
MKEDVRALTKSQYFFKLHPLMVPAGWKVKEIICIKADSRPRHTLLILENESCGKWYKLNMLEN